MKALIARSIHICCSVALLSACSGGSGDSADAPPDPGNNGPVADLPAERVLQGGDTTSFDRTNLAFEHPAANLTELQNERHLTGDSNFAAQFVSPPAPLNPGLGPLFNSSSCDGCHTKNGRGQPIFGNGPRGSQAVIRVSLTQGTPEVPGGEVPVPGIGTQLQDHAIFGATPEGTVTLSWANVGGKYGDGTGYELRKPVFSVELADGSKLPDSVHTSLRTAPPIFGVGLLEAVPQASIEALADPDDANGDGISGHPNYVWDVVKGATTIGRFGRKANRPDLLQQSASAYANDIGVNNDIFSAEGEAPEISGDVLTSVEFYTQTLAVPNAADIDDPQVRQGSLLFQRFNCSGCHVPELRTGSHPLSALSNQRIFPYTDLLVHDMGPDLADGRKDFLASGSEWRTTPLWGIGITATILSATQNYLHDGRARTLEEAILWHGGEAQRSQAAFRNASQEDRAALIRFLKSL